MSEWEMRVSQRELHRLHVVRLTRRRAETHLGPPKFEIRRESAAPTASVGLGFGTRGLSCLSLLCANYVKPGGSSGNKHFATPEALARRFMV